MVDKEEARPAPRPLVRMAAAYAEADAAVDAADARLKDAKLARSRAEKRLVDTMTTEEIQNFRADNLGLFYSEVCVYANVKDKDALHAWLRRRRMKDMFSVSVHGSRLRALTKELLADGKAPPAGVEPFIQTEIRRRK